MLIKYVVAFVDLPITVNNLVIQKQNHLHINRMLEEFTAERVRTKQNEINIIFFAFSISIVGKFSFFSLPVSSPLHMLENLLFRFSGAHM